MKHFPTYEEFINGGEETLAQRKERIRLERLDKLNRILKTEPEIVIEEIETPKKNIWRTSIWDKIIKN